MTMRSNKQKVNSCDPINELLNEQKYPYRYNWLLSYLDVFILVLMLMVTLVSISNFDKKTTPGKKNAEQLRAALKPPSSTKIKAYTKPKPEQPNVNQLKPNENPKEVLNFTTLAKKPSPHLPDQTSIMPDEDVNLSTPLPNEPAPLPLVENQQAQLNEKITQMGLDQAVKMKYSQGFVQIEIQEKVLFRSSEADLTPPGKAVLSRLIPILKESVGIIMIEGHTDNHPIKTKRFPSNWELGASRATSVLHFLVSQQLDSERLRAVSFADTQPIADNETPAGREKNRRVNIVIKVEN